MRYTLASGSVVKDKVGGALSKAKSFWSNKGEKIKINIIKDKRASCAIFSTIKLFYMFYIMQFPVALN